MDENLEFDIIDTTKNMSIDVLHSVKMSAQEAAWFLLRDPMTKSSTAIVYILYKYIVYSNKIIQFRKTISERVLSHPCVSSDLRRLPLLKMVYKPS